MHEITAFRLIRRVARATIGPFCVLIVTSLVVAAAVLALPYTLGRALDTALGPSDPASGGSDAEPTGPFRNWESPLPLPPGLDGALDAMARAGEGISWTQATIGLLLIAAVGQALATYAGGSTAAGNTACIRHLLLGHAIGAGPRLTQSIAPGDLVARATGIAAQAGTAPTHAVATVAAVIPGLGAVVMLFRIDVWCGIAFLAGLALLSVLLGAVVRTVSAVSEQYAVAQGALAGRLAEAVRGARTVAAAATIETERHRVLVPVADLQRHGHALWSARAAAVGQSAALLPLLEVVVLGVAGWQLTAGRITVGDLVATGAYVGLGVQIVGGLTRLLGLAQSHGAARRCADAFAVPATEYGSRSPAAHRGALTLVDVWVGDGAKAALKGITLHIPAGTSVAVVGRSGSGKSTLASLFARLAEPTAGVVCLDGNSVRDLSPEALHTAVTYAFARPALLGGTVADTIAFGHDRPDDDLVSCAARAACADAFISRLPAGYATAVADAPMSGGETQRLGLARAFAHPGRVLILDDATSSLDMATERQINTAVHAHRDRQTRVVVAHRAATAADADLVIWLESGVLRGYAPHRDLWTDPAYRAVFEAAT